MAIINGNGQANTLIGTLEADTIRARGGNDTVLGGEGNDSIIANAGDDSVDGGIGDDTLKGGNGNDWLFGGEGDDMVFGNKGDDTLVASLANDTLNGGQDNDTVIFTGNRADYTVTQVSATVVILTDTAGNAARVVNVETFQFADVTQTFAEVVLPIDDLFIGTAANETFDGGIGDDTLAGDNLNDVFMGGSGVDTFDFSDNTTGVQVIDLGYNTLPPIGTPLPPPPVDLTVASIDNFDITSAPGTSIGVERMIGTDFNDQFQILNGEVTFIDAGAGDDVVLGSFADDTLIGGSGNDQMGGLEGDDLISTGDGFDFVFVDRDIESGTATGDGYDVVSDFDPTVDLLIIEYDAHLESYDPFADLSQTAEGALLSYAADASILLQGVDVAELNAANLALFEEYVASTGF